MLENGQEKAKLGIRETVIQDEDVPWSKPKNPHGFKMVKVDKERYFFDPLRDMNAAPTNEAFKDFVKRNKAAKEARWTGEAQE